MNRLRAASAVKRMPCGLPSTKRRDWGSWVAVIALLVSCAALINSMRGVDASVTAIGQAHRTHEDVRKVVGQINRVNSSLRSGIDQAEAVGDLCHVRLDLVIEAVDAVARTCPGRFRAPQSLRDAEALSPRGSE